MQRRKQNAWGKDTRYNQHIVVCGQDDGFEMRIFIKVQSRIWVSASGTQNSRRPERIADYGAENNKSVGEVSRGKFLMSVELRRAAQFARHFFLYDGQNQNKACNFS